MLQLVVLQNWTYRESNPTQGCHCPLQVALLQSPVEMFMVGLFPTFHIVKSLPWCHGHHSLCVGARLKQQHQFVPAGVQWVWILKGSIVPELKSCWLCDRDHEWAGAAPSACLSWWKASLPFSLWLSGGKAAPVCSQQSVGAWPPAWSWDFFCFWELCWQVGEAWV